MNYELITTEYIDSLAVLASPACMFKAFAW